MSSRWLKKLNLERFNVSDNFILGLSAFLTFSIWYLYSTTYWVRMDGDIPLFPIMAGKVLEGHRYIMTIGQNYGGAFPLTYIRSFLFKLFGLNNEISFLVITATYVCAVFTWTYFTLKIAGKLAALCFLIIAAVANERFFKSMSTDFYVFSMLLAGLLFCYVSRLANRKKLKLSSIFFLGLLVGFSLYTSRFTLLYIASSLILFLCCCSSDQRQLFTLTNYSSRTVFEKTLIQLWFFSSGLGVIAWITSDRFLGINAEYHLKYAVFIPAFLFYLFEKRKLVRRFLKHIFFFMAGVTTGFAPEIYYSLFLKTSQGRVMGLTRLSDILNHTFKGSWISEPWPLRLGRSFCYYSPSGLGLLCSIGALSMLVASIFFIIKNKLDAPFKTLLYFSLSSNVLCFLAWIGLHTEQYFCDSYIAPAFLPLALLAGICVSFGHKFKARYLIASGLTFLTFSISSGTYDLYRNLTSEDVYKKSGLIDLLTELSKKHNIKYGFADFPSNSNLYWLTQLQIKFATVSSSERFPEIRNELEKEIKRRNTFFYIRHKNDLGKKWNFLESKMYLSVADFSLPHGFEIYLLKKSSDQF